MGNLRAEGAVAFLLEHDDPDWPTNSSEYTFPTFQHGGISAQVTKNADRSISVTVSGPLHQDFSFKCPIPQCEERGLHVAIVWKHLHCTLYLNGQKAQSKQVSVH